MALYHLRAKIIQRSQGQSAVKSASYRHGQRLRDERLGKTFSYKKPERTHSAIIAPEGAPAWVFSRHQLWNRAEMAETRRNAQTAREIEASLPRELTHDQQVVLVERFVREAFVARGMVADIAIHVPMGADGRPQPHAHIMLTMRRLDSGTATGFAKTKARDWNEDPDIEDALRAAKDAFRKAETPALAAQIAELDASRNINIWRAQWAAHVNRALDSAGSAARVDHRTLAAQGLARLAQPCLGIARHIEKAYAHVKDRVNNWLSVLKRNELYRAFAPYERRDAAKFTQDVAAIEAITAAFMNHWRQRPRQTQPPIPEVPRE